MTTKKTPPPPPCAFAKRCKAQVLALVKADPALTAQIKAAPRCAVTDTAACASFMGFRSRRRKEAQHGRDQQLGDRATAPVGD